MVVARRPMATTSPQVEDSLGACQISIRSPTSKGRSRTRRRPAIRLERVSLAAKETASPAMPAPPRAAVRSHFKYVNAEITPIPITRNWTKRFANGRTVSSSLVSVLETTFFSNISRSCVTKPLIGMDKETIQIATRYLASGKYQKWRILQRHQ